MSAWHREAVTPAVEQVLLRLQQESLLEDFYLAGGTGLALQLGHRRSVDLDFFSHAGFDEGALLERLRRLDGFSLVNRGAQTLHVEIQGTKTSFLGYDYPVLFSTQLLLGVAVADARDIACMKISAIAARGAKRDFIDLYTAARQYGLGELLRLFREKYARVNYSRMHLLKSLTWFEDAEKEPLPEMLAPIEWAEVKNFFLRESPRQV